MPSSNKVKCPICGSVNTETVYSDEMRIVEYYYNCTECTYAEQMAYSPSYWSIDWKHLPIKYLWKAIRFYYKNKESYMPIEYMI